MAARLFTSLQIIDWISEGGHVNTTQDGWVTTGNTGRGSGFFFWPFLTIFWPFLTIFGHFLTIFSIDFWPGNQVAGSGGSGGSGWRLISWVEAVRRGCHLAPGGGRNGTQ